MQKNISNIYIYIYIYINGIYIYLFCLWIKKLITEKTKRFGIKNFFWKFEIFQNPRHGVYGGIVE